MPRVAAYPKTLQAVAERLVLVQGMSVAAASRTLGVSYSGLWKLIQKMKKGSALGRRNRSTKITQEAALAYFTANPKHSLRQVGMHFGISRSTALKMARRVGKKAVKQVRCQILSEKHMQKRFQWSTWALLACSLRPIRIFAKVQHVDPRKTVFMDEKMFVLGQTAVDGRNAYVWVGSGNR